MIFYNHKLETNVRYDKVEGVTEVKKIMPWLEKQNPTHNQTKHFHEYNVSGHLTIILFTKLHTYMLRNNLWHKSSEYAITNLVRHLLQSSKSCSGITKINTGKIYIPSLTIKDRTGYNEMENNWYEARFQGQWSSKFSIFNDYWNVNLWDDHISTRLHGTANIVPVLN